MSEANKSISEAHPELSRQLLKIAESLGRMEEAQQRLGADVTDIKGQSRKLMEGQSSMQTSLGVLETKQTQNSQRLVELRGDIQELQGRVRENELHAAKFGAGAGGMVAVAVELFKMLAVPMK